MTREDAATLLGVSATASSSEVRRRYEELHNDYQIRLTNAPTPALKKAYQKNLQELQQACEILSPGAVASVPDLPASEPSHSVEPAGSRILRPAAPPPAQTTRVKADAGLPRSTMLAGVAAALCAAAASLFGVLWMQTRQAHEKLQAQAAVLQLAGQQLDTRVTDVERLLKAGPLEVCNRSSSAVHIMTLVAMYRDAAGKLRTIHSGSYDYPTWDIRPGGRTRLNILRGREDDWDGTAAVYALQIGYPGVEPFLVAGFFNDLKEGCVNLYLD